MWSIRRPGGLRPAATRFVAYGSYQISLARLVTDFVWRILHNKSNQSTSYVTSLLPQARRSRAARWSMEPSCLDTIELMSIGGDSIRKASSILAFVGTSIDQLDHPGAEHLGLGEPELQLALLIEETLAAPQSDRVDQQTVLIDKVVKDEGSDQPWGAVDDDILARLLL